MSTKTLEFQRTIKATPADVYRAFTRAVALREWLCDGATAEARVGGHCYFWWNSGFYASGAFTALDQDKRVAFTWQGKGEPAETSIEVRLEATGNVTTVTLTHAGLSEGPEWAKMHREAAEGWQSGMENLQSMLETGLDLRFTRRPMIGILVDDFSPAIAAHLGIPVTAGTRVAGVVEGMGAQKAGLQKDDVVVSINGKPTTNWPEITTALQGRRAGDVVAVEFYRGAEKIAVDMPLSFRPIPEVPASPQALAEAIQASSIETATGLAACFEGVTEEEAARRPEPNEWSALEVVAHFILAERENQNWITDLINDDERWSDRFENTTNVPARIAALTGMYPTIEALLALLKRSQAETVAMLALLPPEFVAHKGSYWRLGRDLRTQTTEHLHEHTAQITAAIAAARQ